jgi:MFS transporter, PAT family, beta-lactamase induction signal transducer AmpG
MSADPAAVAPRRSRSWLADLRVYLDPPVARMLLLGFSAGLPYILIAGTMSFWLREAQIDLATIGFLSWVGLVYAFKWAWAPLVDRLRIPLLATVLGKRRSWLLFAQLVIGAGLVGMAATDPALDLRLFVILACVVTFASATQDIALDAFRIESASNALQGALSASYQVGYRVAGIVGQAGAFALAALVDRNEATYEHTPWAVTYAVMAAFMAVGMLTVLYSREPDVRVAPATLERESRVTRWLGGRKGVPQGLAALLSWMYGAVVSPFVDFVVRYRWHALLLLALIGTYRISDVVMGVMANPFYHDMGFTKLEVAWISKVFGVVMTLVGAAIGGVLTLRFGVNRVLLLGAVLSAATNLLFAWVAGRGHDVWALMAAISADNLSGGMAGAAFVAYLSGLTNVAYSATQYALFSSLMVLLPRFLAGFSGKAVELIGYQSFFVVTAALGVPVLILVWLAGRYAPSSSASAQCAAEKR